MCYLKPKNVYIKSCCTDNVAIHSNALGGELRITYSDDPDKYDDTLLVQDPDYSFSFCDLVQQSF